MGHTGTGPRGSSNDDTLLATRLSKIPGFLSETENPESLKDIQVGCKCRLWMFPNQMPFVVGVSCANSDVYCVYENGSIATMRPDTPVVMLEWGPKLTDDDFAALKRLPSDLVDVLWGRMHIGDANKPVLPVLKELVAAVVKVQDWDGTRVGAAIEAAEKVL